MEEKYNVGAASIILEPTHDGLKLKETRMQKLGELVLELGVEKTDNARRISVMNRNNGDKGNNEIIK